MRFRGEVESIAYEPSGRGKLRTWFIEVRLRQEETASRLFEELDAPYAAQEKTCVEIEALDEQERDAWLVRIIAYLARVGHLDRNQELTAYVSFGLPYASPL
jgi:hypothetical protein